MAGKLGVFAFSVFLLGIVLVVNGAIPWMLSPTFGLAIWALGFAKSFANAPLISIFASNIGAPEPAAIVFGLAAALPMALLLKLGMLPVNAYAFTFAAWLLVAFWGAYRLSRTLGASDVISLLCSVLWLTTPIVWGNQGYCMLALGMALLPFYVYAAWGIIWDVQLKARDCALFLAACVVAVFMDGYSYMMFACACAGLFAVAAVTMKGRPMKQTACRLLILGLGFLISYLLYSRYIGKSQYEPASLDFFRAWGANIEFLLIPTAGTSFLADTLGLSQARSTDQYFGDGSVFKTTFCFSLMIGALVGFFVKTGNWKWKAAFLLIAIGGFYMSLGPSFKFFVMRPDGAGQDMPEQYAPMATGSALLSENLPGFSSMRASYRWVALGAFAAWAVFAASFSGRSGFGGWPSIILCLAIVFNLPALNRIAGYQEARNDLVDIGREADATRTLLHPGETVAFLPWGNDFYLTYLAPNLDIKTFNIGGDKNLGAAVKKWPVSLLRFPLREQDRSISPDYGEKLEAILESGAAQAVALSYIDNSEPTRRWPVSPVFKDDLLRVADELDDNSRLTVENSENYSIIRLKPGLTPAGDPYLMASKKPLTMLPGETLTIAGQPDLAPYFRERGWSALEATGVWSTSESSTLIVRAPEGIEHPLQLTVGFTPYAPRPENQTTVEVLVNGKSVFSKNYVGPPAPVTEKMTMEPALFAQDRTATIEFKVTPLRSPTEFGANDPRKLGLMLHTIAIN